jgi:LAS superfamily LD-carboxypeptidase LdcB
VILAATNHRFSLRSRYGRAVRWVRVLTLGAVVASVLTFATGAGAGSGDARAERERVRRQQAQAAAELDVLKAEDRKVESALSAMNAQVSAQQQQLASAEQAVMASEAEAAAAKAAESAMEARVATLKGALKDMAVEEFITGGRRHVGRISLDSDDLSTTTRRAVLADFVVGNTTELRSELRSASEDLTVARERAEAAATAAVAHRNEVDTKLADLAAARDQQASFAAKLDQRIESRLAESAALSAVDAKLSAEIARQQAALAARNVGRRSSSASSSSFSRGNISLRTVHGITVASSIADALDRMWTAANADGITFGGGGYRDPQQQQALRDAHCPSRNSPASACHPPTARPGHSMHERGLAIDFTTGGRTLTTGSAGYRWLRANAASYGFYNLPGEPWHWSTNGN